MDIVQSDPVATQLPRKEWTDPVVEEYDVEAVTASGPAGFFDGFSFS